MPEHPVILDLLPGFSFCQPFTKPCLSSQGLPSLLVSSGEQEHRLIVYLPPNLSFCQLIADRHWLLKTAILGHQALGARTIRHSASIPILPTACQMPQVLYACSRCCHVCSSCPVSQNVPSATFAPILSTVYRAPLSLYFFTTD
jgi:hypothetical protein